MSTNAAPAQDYETEIRNLCIIAEEPDRAEGFIRGKVPAAEVARSLSAIRASKTPEAKGWDAAVAAVNARFAG